MPLITLDIPHNKIPLVKEFIAEIGVKERNQEMSSSAYYSLVPQDSRHYLPTHYNQGSKGWEFFMNELEYE